MWKGMHRKTYNVHMGDNFINKTSQYRLKDILGSGSFGVVTKCKKLETGETVAVKTSLRVFNSVAKHEAKVLKQLRELGSDNHNIIKFYEDFSFRGKRCLVFEILDISLYDFIRRIVGGGLRVCVIRVIAEQLLVALDFLNNVGIAHRDIKPDNIMLADRATLKVKLIDFGLATRKEDLNNSINSGALSYRAPEETLIYTVGLNVDMWSLGCTLAYLILGDHLFPSSSEKSIWSAIVGLLGHPDDQMVLNSKGYLSFYNIYRSNGEVCIYNNVKYRSLIPRSPLYSPQYEEAFYYNCKKIWCLDDLVNYRREIKDPIEKWDIKSFADLLKLMLAINPSKRISPSDALKHSFITMHHLSVLDTPYVCEAFETMRNYKILHTEGSEASSSKSADPNSKKTTWQKVSTDSSMSKSSSSGSTYLPRYHCNEPPRGNIFYFRRLREMCTSSVGYYPVPERICVCPDSLFNKTSSSDSIHPESSCSKTSATHSSSSLSLESKTPTPKSEFAKSNGGKIADQCKVGFTEGGVATKPTNLVDFCFQTQSSPNNSSTVTESSNSKKVGTKHKSKFAHFDFFNKKSRELCDFTDHKLTPITNSRCMVMNKQHKNNEASSKGSNNTNVPVPDERASIRCENPSHFVEVKTPRKFWKTLKAFFCNKKQTISNPNTQHKTDLSDEKEKLQTSLLRKKKTVIDTPNSKEAKPKINLKTANFNPEVTIINKPTLQLANLNDQQKKIHNSCIKNSSTLTDSPKNKERETKINSKHVRFHPFVTIINKQSLQLPNLCDQQVEKKYSTNKKEVKQKYNSAVPSFNPDATIFNWKSPESADLADQKMTPRTISINEVMKKQHKTDEEPSKESSCLKVSVPNKETLHLAEVKSRKTFWKRISNLIWKKK